MIFIKKLLTKLFRGVLFFLFVFKETKAHE